jgi:hypothetical protein
MMRKKLQSGPINSMPLLELRAAHDVMRQLVASCAGAY